MTLHVLFALVTLLSAIGASPGAVANAQSRDAAMIIEDLRACLPQVDFQQLSSDSTGVTVTFPHDRFGVGAPPSVHGATLMPNRQDLIGNAEPYVNPAFPEIALVFPRAPLILAGTGVDAADERVLGAFERGMIVGCFYAAGH